MGIPTFFRLPKHKTFQYNPRYYDERKERLQVRIKQIEQEMGVNQGDEYVPRISKGSIRGHNSRLRNKKAERQSNVRLLIILIVLLLITYILFFR